MSIYRQIKKRKENITKIQEEKKQGKFACRGCGKEVAFSDNIGTAHRNHCPHCLASRHLDKNFSGDRSTNCGGCMRAIGLTFKKEGSDKYNNQKEGELMIIHKCVICDKISINRLAADDDEAAILILFHESFLLDNTTKQKILNEGIEAASLKDKERVFIKLFGKSINKIC